MKINISTKTNGPYRTLIYNSTVCHFSHIRMIGNSVFIFANQPDRIAVKAYYDIDNNDCWRVWYYVM